MTAYNLGFAKQMNRAAELLTSPRVKEFDEAQAVAYMNLVAIEVAMKAMLEKAGWDAKHLRKRSHDLKGLLKDICSTEIYMEIAPSHLRYVSAARLCSLSVKDTNGAKGTVGAVIDAEARGASKYPNELRYGDNFRHFSPKVLTESAKAVIDFAETYWNSIRKKQGNDT
ncbi:MAG: hypothetical protein ACREBW_02050 [Candidatus Micrarchaeaceae archaeon]